MSGTRHNIPCLNEGLSRWLLVLWPASWLLRSLSLPSWSNHGVKTLLELVLLSGSVSRGFCLICVVNGSETTINDLLESCGLAMGLNLSLKEVNQFFFYPFLFPFINWREGGWGGAWQLRLTRFEKYRRSTAFIAGVLLVLCDTLWQQRRQMEKQSSELRVSFSLPSKNRSLKFPNLKMPFISYLRRSNWSLNFLCTPSHCSRHAKKCLREPFEKAINFSHLLLPGLTRWRKARRIPSFTVFLSQIFISCIFLLLCFINIKIELWCFMIIFTWLIVGGSSATGKGKLHVHDGFFFWRACPLVPLKKNKIENCDFSLFLVFLHQFCIRWYTNKSTNGYTRWHKHVDRWADRWTEIWQKKKQ